MRRRERDGEKQTVFHMMLMSVQCKQDLNILHATQRFTLCIYTFTNPISTSHCHICFDMITANKQDRHYTVWSPRQSFMLQFTRHVMVLLKQTVRRLVLLGSCYKAALCSFLVNKLHTKIWIVCTQTKSCFVSEQVNYVEVVFFDHSCRLLALRGTQPWTHRSSGCPMIFSRSNNQ